MLTYSLFVDKFQIGVHYAFKDYWSKALTIIKTLYLIIKNVN